MIKAGGGNNLLRGSVFCAALILFFSFLPAGCSSGDDDSNVGVVILDTTVTVGANGGYGTVFFQASAGQTIRIALTGPSGTEPYGYLEPPSGNGTYTPPNSGQAGSNQADILLTESGQFSLTIFDGANRGGTITVVVSRIEGGATGGLHAD